MAVTQGVRRPDTAAAHGLRGPATIFLLGVLVHGVDHQIRGLSASPMSIMVAGTIQFAAVVLGVVLVWAGVRGARTVAASVAVVSVLGVTYAHLLPDWWPAFSDSYVTGPRTGVTWFSWVSVVAELGTALVLAVAALRARVR